jgi:hypothetical protein
MSVITLTGIENERGGKNEWEKGTCWQRHTLPHRRQCSTICACGLNCRVRDGTGWTPTALATNKIPALPSIRPPAFVLLFAGSEK